MVDIAMAFEKVHAHRHALAARNRDALAP